MQQTTILALKIALLKKTTLVRFTTCANSHCKTRIYSSKQLDKIKHMQVQMVEYARNAGIDRDV